VAQELYVGLTIDRSQACPVLMTSAEGGVEIEELARSSPDKIFKEQVNVHSGLHPFQGRNLAARLSLPTKLHRQLVKILTGLCRLFIDKDCSLAEINPLVLTTEGELLAADAKLNFDERALYRHPDIGELRDKSQEDPLELQAAQYGISYISLDGNIGCMVNGAGLAMATMDLILLHGGRPANFLDVGGGASTEQVTNAFKLLLSNKRIKSILVNIFGGIMRCDVIAEGVVRATCEVRPQVPVVVRLEGTNVKEGRRILSTSGLSLITAESMSEAAEKAVKAAERQS
jgi:succinyl-CoA synthetase beta subunit